MKSNIYSFENDTGIAEPTAEVLFSQKIDADIPAFVKFVESTAFGEQSEQSYTLASLAARKLLLNFFYRSPYTHEKIEKKGSIKLAHGFLYLAEYLRNGRFPNSTERRRLRNNLLQQQMIQSLQLQNISIASPDLCFVFCLGDDQFISGSNPVVIPNNSIFETLGIRRKQQKNWFLPLSPKVGFMVGASFRNERFAPLSPGSSEVLNKVIFTQSNRVFSKNRGCLLNAISDRKHHATPR